MTKTQPGPIHADRLKSFADRIDRLEEEKKGIGGDIKDVYTEVKSAGYNTRRFARCWPSDGRRLTPNLRLTSRCTAPSWPSQGQLTGASPRRLECLKARSSGVSRMHRMGQRPRRELHT